MRLLFAFYILFSVVIDGCHAIEEVSFAQTAIESQADAQPAISQAHSDCGTNHPASETQSHFCHSAHCTFLVEPQIRIVLAPKSQLQTEYSFYVPQSSVRNLRRPPKTQV